MLAAQMSCAARMAGGSKRGSMKAETNKEQILALIQANPCLSQQELATYLSLSRSAVAGYIAQLTKEGRILGRAYVLPDPRTFLCIGGANIDRKLRLSASLQNGTSNPVAQRESFGGVARNIAENLARLGGLCSLLSVVGDDAAGQSLLKHAGALGIQTEHSLVLSGAASGTYTAVLNPAGEMEMAFSEMELCSALTPEVLQQRQSGLAAAVMLIADLNLCRASIRFLQEEARRTVKPLILIAVSLPKMVHLPDDLQGVRLLILNRSELEQRAGHHLPDVVSLAQACQHLQQQGAEDVLVSLGPQGVGMTNRRAGQHFEILPALPAAVKDVTGAGDAFSAGVCWSLQRVPDDLRLACQRGLQLAAYTIQTETTVAAAINPAIFDEES